VLTITDGEAARGPQGPLTSLTDRAHRDVGAFLSAVATRASQASGLEAIGAALGHDEEEWEDDDGYQERGSVAGVTSTSDLDGDGLADVLIAELDLATSALQLRAVRGTDGTELWRRPFSGEAGLAFPLGQDLDGDGVDDLLVYDLRDWVFDYSMTSDDGLLSSSFSDSFRISYTWTLGVVSGADGTTRWHRDIPAFIEDAYHEEWALLGDHAVDYELTGSAMEVVPLLLDGEVGVSALDVEIEASYRRSGTVLEESEESRFALRSSTDVDVYGEDGSVVRRLEGESEDGVSFYAALPDGSGGLLRTRHRIGEHAVSCSSNPISSSCTDAGGAFGTDLLGMDGRTFATRWADEGEGYREAQVTPDLDGDGIADLLELGFDDEAWTSTSVLRSGADGALRWTAPDTDDWRYPVAYADLDGSGGLDLVTVGFVYDDGWGVRVDRIAGATGDLLATSTISVGQSAMEEPAPPAPDPLGAGWLFGPDEDEWQWSFELLAVGVGLAGDLDGDDGQDLGLTLYRYFESSTGESEESWTARLERARTAEVLHAEGGDGWGYLFPLADVTGDGGLELARGIEEIDDQDTWSFSTQVLAYPAMDAPLHSVAGGYLLAGGDQDGAAGEELLHLATDWDAEEPQTTIMSREGRTGALRWSLTSEQDPR
jgi:hypothetical protein